MKKKIVIFSGAGLDAESGIKTFRDSDGLWENYNVMDVATLDGWHRNRQLVLDFYNERHRQISTVKPNSAHEDIASLESDFEVYNITQNVSDLLERAGCTNVLHLHGELNKMRTWYTNEIYDWPEDMDLTINSTTDDDQLLRPHIVWFGEDVPNMKKAIEITETADIFVIIGSSLQVYPAANLFAYVKPDTKIYVIDPNKLDYGSVSTLYNITQIQKTATEGMKELINILKN